MMPQLQIWSILELYPVALDETCPNCSTFLPQDLEAMEWCNGHAPNCFPRPVHDISWSLFFSNGLHCIQEAENSLLQIFKGLQASKLKKLLQEEGMKASERGIREILGSFHQNR